MRKRRRIRRKMTAGRILCRQASVSGQWDISVLSGMENQKFFYVTAGGDAKASGG